MIEVIYQKGFANQIFQYCFGRILAEKHGLHLRAYPLSGFPNTNKAVLGGLYDSNEFLVSTVDQAFAAINHLPRQSKIVLSGYFQDSRLFLDFMPAIKHQWLKLDSSITPSINPNDTDLVIHVRRSDYILYRWGAPYSYYHEALQGLSFRRLIIVTDDPFDPFLGRFKEYNPVIVSGSYLSDFKALTKASKLVMSPSTFSWWAAVLSDANEIFFPIPKSGIWSQGYHEHTHLYMPVSMVPFHYVKISEELQLSPREWAYHEFKYFRKKLKSSGPQKYCTNKLREIKNILQDQFC